MHYKLWFKRRIVYFIHLQRVKKMIKQSNKAIVQFEKGNRPDLIAKDKYLIKVLEKYQ